MKVSRRKILAGLVAAGVALPAAYYARQEWERAQEAELSSDEPAVPVNDLPNALLGERLVGIWDWRLVGDHPALAELAGPQQLLLDVGRVPVPCAVTWALLHMATRACRFTVRWRPTDCRTCG